MGKRSLSCQNRKKMVPSTNSHSQSCKIFLQPTAFHSVTFLSYRKGLILCLHKKGGITSSKPSSDIIPKAVLLNGTRPDSSRRVEMNTSAHLRTGEMNSRRPTVEIANYPRPRSLSAILPVTVVIIDAVSSNVPGFLSGRKSC